MDTTRAQAKPRATLSQVFADANAKSADVCPNCHKPKTGFQGNTPGRGFRGRVGDTAAARLKAGLCICDPQTLAKDATTYVATNFELTHYEAQTLQYLAVRAETRQGLQPKAPHAAQALAHLKSLGLAEKSGPGFIISAEGVAFLSAMTTDQLSAEGC